MTESSQKKQLPDNQLPDITAAGAILFDLDGVLTPTADIHMLAWQDMFTAFFESQGVAPYRTEDYFTYLDGRRRDEAIAAICESRGLHVPYGSESDSPNDDTVVGLGLRKNEDFLSRLAEGIAPYPGSLHLLQDLRNSEGRAPKLAVVSSSKNANPVLDAAGIADFFELVVDGLVATERGLAGKPAPDTYLYAAEVLGVQPLNAVVVEDAISGVQSGAAGKFGVVIGVDRGAGHDALAAAGATVVVSDLADLRK